MAAVGVPPDGSASSLLAQTTQRRWDRRDRREGCEGRGVVPAAGYAVATHGRLVVRDLGLERAPAAGAAEPQQQRPSCWARLVAASRPLERLLIVTDRRAEVEREDALRILVAATTRWGRSCGCRGGGHGAGDAREHRRLTVPWAPQGTGRPLFSPCNFNKRPIACNMMSDGKSEQLDESREQTRLPRGERAFNS